MYVKPFRGFSIVAIMFIILNYIYYSAHRTEVEDTEAYWAIRPAYLQRLEVRSMEASRDGGSMATVLTAVCMCLHYFEALIAMLSQLLNVVLPTKRYLRILVNFVWFVHLFEVGSCVSSCRRYHATFWTTYRYFAGTLLGGYAQLSPLWDEVKRLEKKERRLKKEGEKKKAGKKD